MDIIQTHGAGAPWWLHWPGPPSFPKDLTMSASPLPTDSQAADPHESFIPPAEVVSIKINVAPNTVQLG